MRTKYKPWAKPFLEEHTEYVKEDVVLNPNYKKHFLEIGSGKGDFIIEMAKKFPEYYFYAVEINVTVAGIACKKFVGQEIPNLTLIVSDIVKKFDNLKDGSFDGIFLNFSDPWPKKRHEKRRLTYIDKLLQYYRLLKDDGKLYFKTDNHDLFLYSLTQFEKSPFKQIFISEDYQFDKTFDAMSEYEVAFRKLGTKINKVIYAK